MGMEFDFSGYATRNDLLCSDGRTIRRDAFKAQDGMTVPLIWNHDHTNPDAVLGHALLENRDDGVYAYCKFNDTESGVNAKKLVVHGDVRSLSIWANKLKHVGKDVVHGKIRELSLVLAGANDGAFIDCILAHSDEGEEEAFIVNYDESALLLYHSDENNEKGDTIVAEETKVTETPEMFNDEQKQAIQAMINQAVADTQNVQTVEPEHKEEEIKHSDDESDKDETIEDVFNTLNEKQKTVVYALLGHLMEEKESEEDEAEHSEGGENEMKVNVFDKEETTMNDVLSHSEITDIMNEAKKNGSLRDTFLAHGIEEIELLFPDHKALNNGMPEFIKRDDDWVAKVLGGVHHSPFARIKTIFADITAAEARAKGYQKGNLKIEEVFKLLKRVTNPTTIYKKQKLDRDDVIDMEFDHLPWLKQEIRMMFNEELARAILIGDGRDPVEEANDKIDEECIRPIWKMEELFTVRVAVPVAAGATDTDRAKAFIKACKKSRKNYKGSGNPSMFMSEDMLTDCLLIEDVNGRVIYETVQQLAAALRVREIIPVPVMEGVTRTDEKDDKVYELAGLYVNLHDYNVGTDKGGEVNFFDDFDLDYNKLIYLMEGRCSGTLVKPHSAVAIEFTEEAAG